MTKLWIFHGFLQVCWILINARFGPLPRAVTVFDFGRSQNAIKTNDKLRTPSTVDLQNDETWTRSNEITSFLKTWFPRPPKVSNLDQSRNAIQTNEKLRKPSNADLQHDQHVNIPLVLIGFLDSAQRTLWASSKAPRNPEFRLFTKCNKN